MLKSWRFWLGLIISAICLFLTLKDIRFDLVADALRGMNYAWLIPAALIFLASYLARVFRWQLLFSPQKIRFVNVFHALNVGYFLSNILPARLGDFIRAYLLGDLEGVSKAQALSTVVVERMSDGLTVVLVFAVTALFVPQLPVEARDTAIGVGVVGIVAITLLLFLSFQKEQSLRLLRRFAAPFSFLSHPSLLSRFDLWIGRFAALRLPRPISNAGSRLLRGLLALFSSLQRRDWWSDLESLIDGFGVLRSPGVVFGIGMWSLVAWIVGGINFWVMMLAMQVRDPQGLLLQPNAAFLVMTVTSLVVVVPSSPGYIGIFHFFATQTLATVFGVDKSVALSYALVMHAFNYFWLIGLGLYSTWHEGLTYQRLQTIQQDPQSISNQPISSESSTTD